MSIVYAVSGHTTGESTCSSSRAAGDAVGVRPPRATGAGPICMRPPKAGTAPIAASLSDAETEVAFAACAIGRLHTAAHVEAACNTRQPALTVAKAECEILHGRCGTFPMRQ